MYKSIVAKVRIMILLSWRAMEHAVLVAGISWLYGKTTLARHQNNCNNTFNTPLETFKKRSKNHFDCVM
jgi:hypothetical protein